MAKAPIYLTVIEEQGPRKERVEINAEVAWFDFDAETHTLRVQYAPPLGGQFLYTDVVDYRVSKNPHD